MLRMVRKLMSVTKDRFQGTHVLRAGTPLQSIGQYAKALVNSVTKELNSEASACNLTPTEFAVIRLFHIEPEWTVTDLAQMLSVNISVMSRAVSRLVEKELLQRRRPREDRRVVLLRLTEDGDSMALEFHEKARAYEKRLTRGIGAEEMENCLTTIRKIVANHAALNGSNSDPSG